MIRSAPEVNDDAQDDKAALSAQEIRVESRLHVPDHGEHLDARSDHLGLAVEPDRQEIEEENRDQADGDPDGGRERGPVRDDDGRGGDLRGDGDGESEFGISLDHDSTDKKRRTSTSLSDVRGQ